MRGEILPPLGATVHLRPRGWRFAIRLWLPLFLLWLLLLPLLLLALPFLFIGALMFGFSLLRSLRAVLALLAGTRGSQVDVESSGTRFFVKLH